MTIVCNAMQCNAGLSQVVTEAETYYFPVIIVKEAAKKMYLGTAAAT